MYKELFVGIYMYMEKPRTFEKSYIYQREN